MLHNSNFFDNIGVLLRMHPEAELIDLFSKGQMDSKRWLVEKLIKLDVSLGTVFICAGWYGSLATFLFEAGLDIEKIRSFDVDPSCADIADTFNRSWVMDGWTFKASTLDIMDMNYPTTYTTYRANGTSLEITDDPDTIINTSCEHIGDFAEWYDKIPDGKLVILQSNDYIEIKDHVNCSDSLADFAVSTPMTKELYSGKLELPKYTRWMRIGIK
jgi:hypothetical protein